MLDIHGIDTSWWDLVVQWWIIVVWMMTFGWEDDDETYNQWILMVVYSGSKHGYLLYCAFRTNGNELELQDNTH